jgi:hemerythrin-like metal-binding protein
VERTTLVEWDDRYLTGDDLVDGQHKRLFALAAEVQTAVREGRLPQVQAEALQKLTHYCVDHFAEEERLMADHAYPGVAEHRRQHDALAERAVATVKAFRAGNTLAGESFPELLSRWLRRHIGEEDVRLVRYLQQRGAA